MYIHVKAVRVSKTNLITSLRVRSSTKTIEVANLCGARDKSV